MITTVNLMGGMGNQLFQWALGRALEWRGHEVQYDISRLQPGMGRIYLLDKLGLNIETTKANLPATFVEGSLLFDLRALEVRPGSILHGFWQSEKYFDDVRFQIREEVLHGTGVPRMSKKTWELAEKICSMGERSCFVHFRRTDNLRPDGMRVHGMPDASYYMKASFAIRDAVPGAHFFLFSDDASFLHTQFGVAKDDVTIVDHNGPSFWEDRDHNIQDRPGGAEHEDLWLMSLCRHAIIANSTFSWWGAWLNENGSTGERIVRVPAPWFATDRLDSSDIIPQRWIKVPSR